MNAVFISRIFFDSHTTKKLIKFHFYPNDIPILYPLFLYAVWPCANMYFLCLFCHSIYLRIHEGRLESDRMHFVFRFLPALITAVLTNHLAWVPTVMPNGQPPIKIFLEKHSSQSVDMLAKTHPYNPLWAQLGM